MVDVGGDLNRQLAAIVQEPRQSRQQRRVVGHPLQRRVGEDDVVGLHGREGGDVLGEKAQPVALMAAGLVEHGGRAVDADGGRRAGVTVELDGQRARAAPEVDDPAARHRLDQGQEVEEGLPALDREALVLLWVPGVRHPPTLAPLVWNLYGFL